MKNARNTGTMVDRARERMAGIHHTVLIVDWCGSCYGEDPQMSICDVCKGTGVNENRSVRP